jgi:hypothetical protein
MKKLKYVKLFESFLNEELSPETKKRTYDAMVKIANDENNIDSPRRRDQANNVLDSVSPAVENLKKQLEEYVTKNYDMSATIRLWDYGLRDIRGFASNTKDGYVLLVINNISTNHLSIYIGKEKYQKGYNSGIGDQLYKDRTFVNILKKLIVQIQNDEIPGDEIVPSEPESVTPEGDIDKVVQFPLE